MRATLIAAAQAQRADPLAFVRNRELFGDLVDDERFTEPYLTALNSLHTLRRSRDRSVPRRLTS